ncbi:hypothetical protein JGU66_08055 [Myxococcaceae bacterium JPH2]|nr:hypothetical protein [Myxococcaceae bacterium JPH2]
MIRELGAQAGDAVLDPDFIVQWFHSLATIFLEEARRLVAVPNWPSLPVETLLTLRRIKNALNTLSFISESGVALRHPELNDWLRLRSRLP